MIFNSYVRSTLFFSLSISLSLLLLLMYVLLLSYMFLLRRVQCFRASHSWMHACTAQPCAITWSTENPSAAPRAVDIAYTLSLRPYISAFVRVARFYTRDHLASANGATSGKKGTHASTARMHFICSLEFSVTFFLFFFFSITFLILLIYSELRIATISRCNNFYVARIRMKNRRDIYARIIDVQRVTRTFVIANHTRKERIEKQKTTQFSGFLVTFVRSAAIERSFIIPDGLYVST